MLVHTCKLAKLICFVIFLFDVVDQQAKRYDFSNSFS